MPPKQQILLKADSRKRRVWIYGGGLYAGSSADPQYNLSGIVKVSQDIKEPILAVSFNYRLGISGFRLKHHY